MIGFNRRSMEELEIEEGALDAARSASRRSILRGLAATLLVAAGGGMAASSQAKKRRGRKNRKKSRKKSQQGPRGQQPQPATCTPGEVIARVSVPADGSTVESPVLLKNVDYVIKPSGFWGTGSNILQDAVASFTFADPFSPRLFTDGVRTGLLLDDVLPDVWGPYQPNHSYGIVVIGKGKPVRFRMLDSGYTGNNGVVHVDISCAVQRT